MVSHCVLALATGSASAFISRQIGCDSVPNEARDSYSTMRDAAKRA